MSSLINLEILGHPISIVVIILMIVLFWFAMYAVNNYGTTEQKGQ